MARNVGTTGARRRLGRELKGLRLASNRTAQEAADVLECSQSKISRLEGGLGIPRARDVRDLLDLYNVRTKAKRDELIRLAERGQARGWWEDYRDVEIADHLMRLITLEEDVESYLSFEPEFVPGLLQSPLYIHEVIGTAGLSEPEVARRTRFRLQRQEEFYGRSDHPRLEVILGQGALASTFVGVDALAEQVEDLKKRVDNQAVDLRILPSDAVCREALGGPFLVMRFAAGEEDLVYLENREGGQYIESAATADRYSEAFVAIREQAWGLKESRTWLDTLPVG